VAAVRGRRWWLCLCLPLLAACQPFNDARPMMDEYLERVARVLDLEPHYSPITPPRQMPRRRDRVLSMPELELGMLDFLSLYGCELQYVVGERNSIMGRVMQPANRLRYELRFIQAARTCMPTLVDDDLRTVLAEAVASKRASLPLAVWNATWGTAEVETLFTLSKGDYPVAAEGNPVADLGREARQLDAAVARLLAGDLSVSLDFLDLVLQRWQADYRAGQLLQSASRLVARLDDATALVRQRLEGRPLCLNGRPNPKADIARSLFFKIYIGRVQPYLSDVIRARDALIWPLARLAERQADTMPETFRPWYRRYLSSTAADSLWRALDRAIGDHTQAWQRLLEQCGMRPGG
jgi:hypothetical protein